jgi:hypothetical protein
VRSPLAWASARIRRPGDSCNRARMFSMKFKVFYAA